MRTLKDYFLPANPPGLENAADAAEDLAQHSGEHAPVGPPDTQADTCEPFDRVRGRTGGGYHPAHHHLTRHALEHQLAGKLHPWATAVWKHACTREYKECRLADGHPWDSPVLGPRSEPLPGAISCAQFDSQGELLLSGTDLGTLLVHGTPELLEAARLPGRAGRAASDAVRAAPMLAVAFGAHRISSVRWCPSDENLAGAASSLCMAVKVYDLQHTRGLPSQSLVIPAQSSGGVGAGDLAFFSRASAGSAGGGGYSLLAGGLSGQVFLWDLRAGGAPAGTLKSLHGGGVAAVQLADGDNVVLAGTTSGEVKAWDLRGGSGGALRFGGVPHRHPMLSSVSLRSALAAVPGLAAQAGGVPTSAVHSMQLQPRDPRRLAFHLACGWSGVLDLMSQQVTHVHAPPPAHLHDEPPDAVGHGVPPSTSLLSARRRACWAPDGERYAVPSRLHDALVLLDFSDSRHAGCYALAAEDEEEEDEGAGARRVPPEVAVPLSQGTACAAALPGGELLVAGGAHSMLSLIAPG